MALAESVPFHNGLIVKHDHERDILFSLRMPESVSDIAVYRRESTFVARGFALQLEVRLRSDDSSGSIMGGGKGVG